MSDARRSVLNSLEQRAGPPIRAIVIAPMLHCIWTTVRHHFIAWRETASQANTFKCNGDGLLSIAFWTEAGYRFPHNYTSLLPPTFYHRWRREGNLTTGLPAGRKGANKMSQDDLWLKIGNKCLSHAMAVLNNSVTPTEEMANLVQKLVSVAIAIDQLNLQWAAQNRYGAAVYQDPASARTRAKN